MTATARTAPEQLQANEWIPVSLLHIFPLGLAWERVVSWLAFSLGEGGPDGHVWIADTTALLLVES